MHLCPASNYVQTHSAHVQSATAARSHHETSQWWILQRKQNRVDGSTHQTRRVYNRVEEGSHICCSSNIIGLQCTKSPSSPSPRESSFVSQLTPFVSRTKPASKGQFTVEDGQGPMSGELYLNRWKSENGAEGVISEKGPFRKKKRSRPVQHRPARP